MSSIAQSAVRPAPTCLKQQQPASHTRRSFWHPDAMQFRKVEDGSDSSKAVGVEEGVARHCRRANPPSPLGHTTAAYKTSFSWMPIVAISLTLVVLTTTLSSLYTYVGVYVQHVMNLDSRNSAGYYAGWLTSAFMLGRLTTGYAWGIFADRYGRKPVLVIGMISAAVCSIGFGLSTSFATALLWRLFFGMTVSVWSASRIIIPEILGPDRVVLGMACMPASNAMGVILGPAVGGLLAQPAENYPEIFSDSGLFGRHPFLLPNLALAILALVFLPLVLIYLPETLHMVDMSSARVVARTDSFKHVGSGSGTSAELRDRAVDYDDDNDPAKARGEDEDWRANGLASRGGHGVDVLMNKRVYDLKSQELRQSARTVAIGSSTRTVAIGSNSVSSTASFVDSDDLMYGSGGDQKGSGEYGDAGSRYPRVTSMLAPLCCDWRGSCRARSLSRGLFSCCHSSTRVWSIVPSSSPSSGVREGGGRGLGAGGRVKFGGSDNWFGPGGLLTPWSVRMILVVELLLAVTKIGFDEGFPLWAIITRDDGGLEWPITKIGKVLSWTGVGMLFYQFIGYPFLCRTVGIVRMLHVMGVMASVAVGVMPDILRRDWSNAASYYVSIAIVVVVDAGTSVWIIGAALAAVNAVPVHQRGHFMGLFTIAETFGRAVSPTGVGSLLAWSVQYSVDHSDGNNTSMLGSLLDYHLTFVILALTFFVAVAIGSRILTLETLTIPLEERRAMDGVHGGDGIVGSADDRHLAPDSSPSAPLVVAP